MLCNNAGISDQNYMLHSYEYCRGICNNRNIKGGMGGSVRSRSDTVKQYNKSEENGRNI